MTHSFPHTLIGKLVLPVSTCNPEAAINEGAFRYIDLSSVDQHTKAIELDRRVLLTDAPSRARQLVKSGDVLVSTVRPNLNAVAMVPDRLDGAIASTGFCVLRPNPKLVSNAYLFHWVRAEPFISAMVRRATGASYPAVSDRIVAETTIPLPPLEEQRRIAAILDKANALRQKRRLALQRLDALTQSLFLDMFGDPVANPKRWPSASLGALVASGPQNGLYKPAEAYGEGTPILRIDAFYDGEVTDFTKLKRLQLAPAEVDLYRLHENDIVVNRVNSMEFLGKSALIAGQQEDTVFESNMMRFSVDRDHVEPRYLIAFLQSSFIKGQILQRSKNAVNQSSINQDDVQSFLIRVPPIAIQREFASRITRAKRCVKECLQTSDHLDALFASLQHRAFRGEL